MAKTNTVTTNTESTVESAKTGIDVSKYAQLPTISGKIRAMAADGYSRGAIAKALGKRYQHVRNVLIQPLKKPVAQVSA